MKKSAITVVMILALSAWVCQTRATITAHYDQHGDALIFPVYYGMMDNYFTIQNHSASWIQGHLRFRGAVWGASLQDFDILLPPNDKWVFRLADVDGDGNWEIDQTLDPNNFMYTGLDTMSCSANRPDSSGSDIVVEGCMDFSTVLFPKRVAGDEILDPALYPNITDQALADQKLSGSIEFFGEAVLTGCCDLNGDGNQNDWPLTAWDWSEGGTVAGKLDGVGNDLSGEFAIALPGFATGIAGAALMLRDFRTDNTGSADNPVRRRVENYPGDPEVIVHNDNPTVVDDMYIYRWGTDSDDYESAVGFNNTWGPMLADGDDYRLPAGTYRAGASGNPQSDYWDDALSGDSASPYNPVNSIAELEIAFSQIIQQVPIRVFDGGFTDNNTDTTLSRQFYFARFPTKLHHAEHRVQTHSYQSLSHVINLDFGQNIEKHFEINELRKK